MTTHKGEREEALEEAREHVRRCTGNEHLMTWEDSKRLKLAKALLSSSKAEGEMREKAVAAAMNAPLPDNYQWGEDAMEAFNFGKTCAANAVDAALSPKESDDA